MSLSLSLSLYVSLSIYPEASDMPKGMNHNKDNQKDNNSHESSDDWLIGFILMSLVKLKKLIYTKINTLLALDQMGLKWNTTDLSCDLQSKETYCLGQWQWLQLQ